MDPGRPVWLRESGVRRAPSQRARAYLAARGVHAVLTPAFQTPRASPLPARRPRLERALAATPTLR